MGDHIRAAVRETYAKIAAQESDGCCGPTPDCCGSAESHDALGYSAAEKASVPEGADLGLGCGNPLTIADLQPGETVLDLGSGPGLDCFLAADAVGSTGHVIGVDMTHEMISRARGNAESVDAQNVEFRLGEIEHLPVADSSVDVILSSSTSLRTSVRCSPKRCASSSRAAAWPSMTSWRAGRFPTTRARTWTCTPAACPAQSQ